MRWHVALKLMGSVLVVAAVTVMSLQVRVGGSGQSGRSCGSSLDVIADRTGWEVWYAQDTIDVPEGSTASLVRTIRCPAAVNARSIVAGSLGAAGVVALLTAAAVRRGRSGSPVPTGGALVVRLRRLGAAATIIGTALVLAGLLALGLLLADGDAALFTFVRRSLVAAIGVVVLAPVLALLTGGRALTILARALEDREHHDETL